MMKEVNNGWGFFRKKLQDYDMPAEKGDWAEFEQMFDQTPPPTPTAPNGGSSLFGGMAGKLIGLAMIVSVAGIALYSITSGSGTTNDTTQNSNQSIQSPNTNNENKSTIANINLNTSESTGKTAIADQQDKDQTSTDNKLGSLNNDQVNSENTSTLLNQNEVSNSNTRSSGSLGNNNEKSTQAKNIVSNSTPNLNRINANKIPQTVQQIVKNDASKIDRVNFESNIVNKLDKNAQTISNESISSSVNTSSTSKDLSSELPNLPSTNSAKNNSSQNKITSSLVKDKENQVDEIRLKEQPSFDWNQEIQELPKGDFKIPFLNGPDHSIDSYIDALIGPIELSKKAKRGIDVAVSSGFIYSSGSSGKIATANLSIGAHLEIPVFKRGGIEIGIQHFRMGNFKGSGTTAPIIYNGIPSQRITTIEAKKFDFVRIPIKYKHYLNNRRIAISAGVSLSGEGGNIERGNYRIVDLNGNLLNTVQTSSSSTYDLSLFRLGMNVGAEYQLNNKFSLYASADIAFSKKPEDITPTVGGHLDGVKTPSLFVEAGMKWHALSFKKDKLTYLALKAVGGSTIGIGSNDHSFSTSYLFGANISYRFGKTWELETGLEIFRINGYRNPAPYSLTNNILNGIETNFYQPLSTWKLQAKYPLRIKKHLNEKWVTYAGVAFSNAYDYTTKSNVTTSFSNSSDINNSVQNTDANFVVLNDNAWSLSIGGEYKINNSLSVFGDLEYYVIDGHRASGAATGPLVNTGIKYSLFRL